MTNPKLKRLHSHKPRRRPHFHPKVRAWFKLELQHRPAFVDSEFDLGPSTHRAYYVRLAIEHQLPGPAPHDGSAKMSSYGVTSQSINGVLTAIAVELQANGYNFMPTAALVAGGSAMSVDQLTAAIVAVTQP